jgi:hypothetical protein
MAVMTTRFVSAAELMARVLGFPGYAFAVIAHPLSSAGDDALREMAADPIGGVLGDSRSGRRLAMAMLRPPGDRAEHGDAGCVSATLRLHPDAASISHRPTAAASQRSVKTEISIGQHPDCGPSAGRCDQCVIRDAVEQRQHVERRNLAPQMQ